MQSNFYKAFSLNSIATGFKIITGLIISKFTAVFLGAEGIALLGNLKSFFNSVQSFSSLGVRKGVVKYASKYQNDSDNFSKLISTYFISILVVSLTVSILTTFFSRNISVYLFKVDKYFKVISWFSFGLFFQVLHLFLTSILNGFSQHKKFNYIQIFTSIFTLIITTFCIWKYNLDGIMFVLAILPGLFFFITLFVEPELLKFLRLIKFLNFDFKMLKSLFEYALMSLVSALIIPPTLIAIRNYIVETDSLTHMGLWEAMNRVSNYIYMFTSSFIGLYLYPKLSKSENVIQSRKYIYDFMKTFLPIISLGLIVLFLFKFWVVKLILSADFLAMIKLFKWQLLGDFFRIVSSIIAFQFFAKKMTIDYIITEILSAIIWYLASVYFINIYGYEGGSIGYFVCYLFYFLMITFWFRKLLFFRTLN